MKKVIQFIVVLASILAILWIARNNPVWARQSPASSVGGAAVDQPANAQKMPVIPISEGSVNFSPQADKVEISQPGTYYVGGLCMLDVTYNLASGLKNEVDVNVSLEESLGVQYDDEGSLDLPGCHLVHYKFDQVVAQADSADGSWKVCFVEQPDVNLTVYYYPDESPTNWIALETTHENGLACASALYTGEYAPGRVEREPVPGEEPEAGTVVPPPSNIDIRRSGIYQVGGVCVFTVVYNTLGSTDNVHVQDPINGDPVDNSDGVPFPDNSGLLYLPGCHVIHYKNGQIIHWETDPADGTWKICFALRPGVDDMKIYYYLGDLTDRASDWLPLRSTIENGMVCAPANYTAVYAPAGK